MNPFRNAIAIVTGGASGIGRALCEELGRRGAVVAAADINLAGAEAAAAAVRQSGGRATAVEVDVTRAADVERLVAATADLNGRLDFMFNNAGAWIFGEALDIPIEDWRWIIDLNLWGVVYGTRAAYAVMARQRSGHIVNTASLAGVVGAPTVIPYTAAKHAVVGLSTALRVEAAGFNVRVTVVCPGYVRTGIFDAARYAHTRKEDVLANIRLPFLSAERAARAILHATARNRAVAVFPAYARFVWKLQRLSPALGALVMRKLVRDLRAMRPGRPPAPGDAATPSEIEEGRPS